MQYYIGKTFYISLFNLSQMCDYSHVFFVYSIFDYRMISKSSLPC